MEHQLEGCYLLFPHLGDPPPHAKKLMLQDSAYTVGTILPASHREVG